MKTSTLVYFATHTISSVIMLVSLVEYCAITIPFLLGAIIVEIAGRIVIERLKKKSR